MEAELNLALSEIQELLRKRKYKTALAKLQRILDSSEARYYSSEALLSLLLVESSTLNKLLERNLLKKYKYEQKLIEELIQLLTKNLSDMHELLIEILQAKGEVTVASSRVSEPSSFPLVPQKDMQTQIKLEKLETNKKRQGNSPFQKYIEQFIHIVNVSTINILEMMAIYRKEVNWQDIETWAEISVKRPSSLSGRLSQAKMQLLFGKMLSMESKDTLRRAQGTLERATDQLIDCLHLSNVYTFRSKDNDAKFRKYSHRQKQCYKLLIIALVMSNKNNMKLGRQEVAALGCNMIKSSVQCLGHGFGFFKRLLQPEIYLFEQFLRYRVEKNELMDIVNIYFPELLAKAASTKQECLLLPKKWERNPSKQIRYIRTSNQKNDLEEISTAKTINAALKRKGNSSCLSAHFRNNSKDSFKNSKEMAREMGDTIITKLIIGHIEEVNHSYIQMKNNIGSNTYFKKMQQHSHAAPKTQKTLKKQKITTSSNHDKHHKSDTADNDLTKLDTRHAKLRLQRKARLNIIQNDWQEEPPVSQLSKEISNCKHFLSLRQSQDHSFEQEEPELNKYLNIGRKTKIFVEILFQNKGVLGLKKIVQKFEVLKKKEDQKQKMVSNRVTSCTSRERGPAFRNMNKFKVIAEEILRTHIDNHPSNQLIFANDKTESKQQKLKLIRSNYKLGQDSIEAIKTKLIGKMDRKERVTDRSQLNEEQFKQKLKRLGSTNFFLKRAPHQNDYNLGCSNPTTERCSQASLSNQ